MGSYFTLTELGSYKQNDPVMLEIRMLRKNEIFTLAYKVTGSQLITYMVLKLLLCRV
jgi:hypothetical protein